MTAMPGIDPARLLHESLESASPDVLQALLSTVSDVLMGVEIDAAPAGAQVPSRHFGYWPRTSAWIPRPVACA